LLKLLWPYNSIGDGIEFSLGFALTKGQQPFISS